MNVSLIHLLIILVGLLHYSSETCEHVSRCSNYQSGYCRYSMSVWECTDLENFEEIPNDPTYLNISKSNIQVIQPALFACSSSFSSLYKLWMPSNNITLLEPGSFKGLTSLNELSLAKNKIEKIHKGVFNRMESLLVLDLSHNQIQTIDNDSFTRTDNLGTLYLNDNLISNTAILIDNCKQVRVLDLSNNILQELQYVKSCPLLDVLNVSSNSLSGLSGSDLSSTITFLELSDNNISYIQRTDLQTLYNLRTLNLSRNPLFAERDMHVDLFQGKTLLTSLNLSSTSIKKLSVGVFSPVTQLRVLDLSSNNLVYLPKTIFYECRYLQEVYLADNRLSIYDFEFNFNYGSPALNKIDIDRNLFSCDSLLSIMKKFGNEKFLPGTSYNSNNIYGIACQEEKTDFRKIETYTSSGVDDLQTEYISHLIKTQTDLRETFVQSKDFLKQIVQNIPVLKKNLDETSLHLQVLGSSMRRQRFDEENLLINFTKAFDSLQKLTNLLTSLKNDTDFEGVVEERNENAMKQLIMELKNILSFNNNLLSTKADASSINSLQTMQAEAVKHNSPQNKSVTVASYCIVAILLVILCLLIMKQYKRYKHSRDKSEENNPLNTLLV